MVAEHYNTPRRVCFNASVCDGGFRVSGPSDSSKTRRHGDEPEDLLILV